MSRRFTIIWLWVGGAVCVLVFFAGAFLSQMALSTTGYVAPPPWGDLAIVSFALFAYWSALCWGMALLQRRNLLGLLLIALALAVAFLVPIWDQSRYERQQAQAKESGLIGLPPDWAGTTALIISPSSEDCRYECWNLATSMEARVFVLIGQGAQDVDFSSPVDLTALSYQEYVNSDGDEALWELVPVVDAPVIDYVVVHTELTADFDGTFDNLRPNGIPERGLHLDILLQGVPDQTSFNIAAPDPLVRLIHVSRTIAEQPYMPFLGRRLYWNASDRRDNLSRARSYFCSTASRDPHFCGNAFR